MIVAVIPARGGSKRLPRKNILPFAGKPLINHSIEIAKACPSIDIVVVSTEDSEIIEIAENAGAEVVIRPSELSGDFSKPGQAAQHVYQTFHNAGRIISGMVWLQPTNPLRTVSIVEDGIALFKIGNVDTVFTVSQNHRKFGTIREDIFVPEYELESRSQDLSLKYYENGVLYISNPKTIKAGRIIGERIKPLVIDSFYALGDIDTEIDFAVAQFLFNSFPEKLR